MTELHELIDWFLEYAEQPLDPKFIALADQKNLPTATLLALGHGMALTVVTGKIQELLRKREAASGTGGPTQSTTTE